MFWTDAKRIMRSGFVGFWRSGIVSFASTLVMAFTLFVIGSLIFLGAMLNSTLDQIIDKVDVNVYFVTGAEEGDILSLKERIENMPEVAGVEYVSEDQALENFRRRHQNDELIIQALDELENNPLGAQLNIKAKDPSQYESVANFLEGQGQALSTEEGIPIIDKINFFQNKAAIDRLNEIIGSTEKLSFAIALVLVAISILITFNTIRLAIYTSKEEIAVMRLVGASYFYVRGPFLVQGIMSGIFAAIIALVLFYPLTLWLGPSTKTFFGGISLFDYYVNNFGQMFLIIVASGVVLGAVSSWLAVKRYLRV